MHALIVDHTSALGGAEFSLETLVERMPYGRCRYTVALPGPGPFAERLRDRRIAVAEVRLESWRWWKRNPWQAMKFFVTAPLQVFSFWRWLRFLRQTRPDLVHLNVNRLVEPLLAAWLLHIPVVVHFRDIPSRMRFRFVPGTKSFYRLMNLASAWIANSTATADDIKARCRRPLHVIPNAIDLEEFDASRAARGAEARALLLTLYSMSSRNWHTTHSPSTLRVQQPNLGSLFG